MRSAEFVVRSAEFAVRSVEFAVRSSQCGKIDMSCTVLLDSACNELFAPFLSTDFPWTFNMATRDPALCILSEMAGVADMLPFNKEYETVEAQFLTALGSPKACVSAIFKMRNDDLKAAFAARRHDIASRRGADPEVVTAYHGTSLAAAASISVRGFDPSYSTIAVYGRGTYASSKPATALTYCKDVKTRDNFSMVFVCDFAKGVFGTPGASNDFTAESDYGGSGRDDVILVTPYADAIVPNYLICFYKWAV
jgi:hypothetical protein